MLREFLNNVITKIKGEKVTLDSRIPISYFIGVIIDRFIMIVRGVLVFKRKYIFLGSKITIKCKSKIYLGKNIKIASHCYIDALSLNGINIGNNVNLGKYCRIECTGSMNNIGIGLVIEDGVGLNSNCFLGCAGGVRIEKDTIIGELVTMHSENHNYSDLNQAIKHQGVTRQGIRIGSGCWIGAKATILDGVIMENGCIVAAGSVVVAGVYKANCIYGGVPAKFLKNRINENI